VSDPSRRFGSRSDEGPASGWFTYEVADGQDIEEEEDPVVGRVELRNDEYAGPFWDDEEHLSEEFQELHRWLGISRELFDDVMTWNDEFVALRNPPTEQWKRSHFVRQQELLRRLAQEVRPGIEVDAPRAEPPSRVMLRSLNVDTESGSRLVVWSEEAIQSGQPRTLPPVPEDLVRRVESWVAEAWKYEHGTPENSDELFAWEDDGSAIARDLQEALGREYEVKGF